MALEDLKFSCKTVAEELAAFKEIKRLFAQAWEALEAPTFAQLLSLGNLIATAGTWASTCRSQQGYWVVFREAHRILNQMHIPLMNPVDRTAMAHLLLLVRQFEEEYDYAFPHADGLFCVGAVFVWKDFDSGQRRVEHDLLIARHTP